jgi:hypothetical protein
MYNNKYNKDSSKRTNRNKKEGKLNSISNILENIISLKLISLQLENRTKYIKIEATV